MDLRQHLQILKESKLVLAFGVVVGVALVVLTTYSVGWDGGPKLSYRQAEVYESQSTLYMTDGGFPEGTTIRGTTGEDIAVAADPERLAELSYIYSNLAVGDQVRKRIGAYPPGGSFFANPVKTAESASGSPLPFLSVVTTANRPEWATDLNVRAIKALQSFVKQKQDANDIPQEKRIKLAVVNSPAGASLIKPRTKTLPLAAFALSILAALGLAYTLANLRRTKARADDFQGDLGPGVHRIAPLVIAGNDDEPRSAVGTPPSHR